jgi:uncharacterized protein YgbK (DUF1537 family)
MSITLGCVADDFTGATDLANTLVGQGMRTVQIFNVPERDRVVPDADAVVVALKSRTIPAAEAVAQSIASLQWLKAAGARQFFFKYCSTFDSTPAGNIGPVADAMLDALEADFTLACPAFPENGRTICHGYLFVGDVLLSESGMKDHPLTPMTDANLVRVLAAQTSHPVGLVSHHSVARGADAIGADFAALREEGKRYAIVDALSDQDLFTIGEACADLPLVTGGSGIALGLPANYRLAGWIGDGGGASDLPSVGGLAAVLSGSCSLATLEQVAHMRRSCPAFALDPLALAEGEEHVKQAIEFATSHVADGPPLIYASAAAGAVQEVQEKLGRAEAGELVERAMARIACALVDAGVRRLVVAGGETSGAVVQALGVDAIRIGRQIDPGVPWTQTVDDEPLALALKSGNFGAVDFFTRALEIQS